MRIFFIYFTRLDKILSTHTHTLRNHCTSNSIELFKSYSYNRCYFTKKRIHRVLVYKVNEESEE